MATSTLRLEACSIVGMTWDLEEEGELTLVAATEELVAAAHDTWAASPALRIVDWSWVEVRLQSHETFALIDGAGNAKALWASEPDRLRQVVRVGPGYRLDFFEIEPRLRGGLVGYYSAAIACHRALDAGANSVLVPSLPGATKFWVEKLGARAERVVGWHVPRGLVGCYIDRSTMEDLKGDADAVKKPEKSGASA
jgi:hypothetical protein